MNAPPPPPLDPNLLKRIVATLARTSLFEKLPREALARVAAFGELRRLQPGDVLVSEGEPSNAFWLVLAGEVAVRVSGEGGEPVEIARLGKGELVGEMGVLLASERTASVVADSPAVLMAYDESAFEKMFNSIPGFGYALSRSLAARLAEADRRLTLPSYNDSEPPDDLSMSMLPFEFVQRHQVVPLKTSGDRLTIGFVNDPTPRVVKAIRHMLPGVELRAVRIDRGALDRILETRACVSAPATRRSKQAAVVAAQAAVASAITSSAHVELPPLPRGGAPAPEPGGLPPLDTLLERVVAEGASDLHLSAGVRPRWRIDGEMYEVGDLKELSRIAVLELLAPTMNEREKAAFAESNDLDFAYELEGSARFRVNLFRDHRGVSAVLRQIPSHIMTFDQLGLPDVIRRLCELPKGLVLVTGPTGSGKTTTLAAMVDYINKSRRAHIITLEDPIEFVHDSQSCLVNQREVGSHTESFSRALRAALREDPDIVLVGELRDVETISLAIETANTGHLVFGTLHTNTAVSTVERLIGTFPPDEQSFIRNVLAETLMGVVAQTLCKRIGGGRVAALEILVSNHAVANLIREGKTYQIPSSMLTGKQQGNRMLNEHLAELVRARKVDLDEALARAVDKSDLAKRLNPALKAA